MSRSRHAPSRASHAAIVSPAIAPKTTFVPTAAEAAGAGAAFRSIFFKNDSFWLAITLPLILKPLTPLLISAFAFNFNNFVLISLLTGGRPDFLDTKLPAGTTDILVSYTYRIAFTDSGQNFGLADARGLPFDFLKPKRPAVQRDLRKIRILSGLAATVVVLAAMPEPPKEVRALRVPEEFGVVTIRPGLPDPVAYRLPAPTSGAADSGDVVTPRRTPRRSGAWAETVPLVRPNAPRRDLTTVAIPRPPAPD